MKKRVLVVFIGACAGVELCFQVYCRPADFCARSSTRSTILLKPTTSVAVSRPTRHRSCMAWSVATSAASVVISLLPNDSVQRRRSRPLERRVRRTFARELRIRNTHRADKWLCNEYARVRDMFNHDVATSGPFGMHHRTAPWPVACRAVITIRYERVARIVANRVARSENRDLCAVGACGSAAPHEDHRFVFVVWRSRLTQQLVSAGRSSQRSKPEVSK